MTDITEAIKEGRVALAEIVNSITKEHGTRVSAAALQLVAGELVGRCAAHPDACAASTLLAFLDGFRLAFDAVLEHAQSAPEEAHDHEHDRRMN